MSGDGNRRHRPGGSLAMTAALAAAGAIVGAVALDHVQAQQENRPSMMQGLFRWFSEDVLGVDSGGAGSSRRGRRLDRSEIQALPTRIYQERAAPAGVRDEKTMCAVCLESFNARDSVMRLPCFHEYHTDCISEYLTAAECPLCPVCRHPVAPS